MAIFQSDVVWGFNIHQFEIMEQETGLLWLCGLGLATKCMSHVTSVYLVSFYFINHSVLNVMKVFLSLQVCFLMSLEL